MATELTTRKVFTDPIYLFACGFGSGLLPIMPGTWATLLAIPIYLVLSCLSLPLYLLATIAIAAAAVWASDRVSAEIGVHDDSRVNIDEIVGYLVTMIAAPAGFLPIVLGFVYFRVLDILKPWPLSWLDRNVGGGIGMILDDVVAGVAAGIAMQVTIRALEVL